jgi:hypothetical protein
LGGNHPALCGANSALSTYVRQSRAAGDFTKRHLTTVDETLARNKALIGTISSVGRTIRNLYQLEQQIYGMVTSRIRAVQSVWTRMKEGIFDPAQNLRDLEEYLKYSIGKPSEERIARIELLANQDAEFEQYMYLRELAYGRLANAEKKIKELEAQLAAEMGKPKASVTVSPSSTHKSPMRKP